LKKILMILTSHRLDCFRLCVDMLALGGSGPRFDKVVILCSGVEGRHLQFVKSLKKLYPEVHWDFIFGTRGRGKPISDMQNECVRRYPDAVYFKLDEDTFVSRDWDIEMMKAYEAHKDDPSLSLMTAVVTNNQRGAYHLMTTFAELGVEFTRRFSKPIVTDRMGPVWLYPQCAEFIIRRFLDLNSGNQELRKAEAGPDKFDNTGLTFSYPFSINCICYDYRHWQEIGGVPEQDENGWGEWIPANCKYVVLVTSALVHHYSFFVQQKWLDRTSLLEDIRRVNLPDTHRPLAGYLARAGRIAEQIPRTLKDRVLPSRK
jgi:hypothetical protein